MASVLGICLVSMWVGFAIVIAVVVLLGIVTAPTYHEGLMRERRQHAEEAARVIQRMAAIRDRTLARMDAAERDQSP